MKMKQALPTLLLGVSFLLTACSFWQEQHYALGQMKDIQLQTAGPGAVYHLDLDFSGQLEGKGTLVLLLNGKPYQRWPMQDKITGQYQGDWYAPEAQLRWQPEPGTRGELKLRYRFLD
ncbi:hypothetical protein COW36_15460 [bacterium (Candidatus Blackallbacteria) CG17_big_fil_post_rev_8_21_14_2_50_48_46]|uniref:Uncharacterized protein n=1 Tax=bacterium (Candidatus Blackallbacteria) CG17_big_fil_post_rev_8_21_14_2_50_48_46 TaxID=2014261 RepID=A0A2M7G351_9BACT|nr:MAG: hypothetical protein COW64_16430 [bacterium (Candidatus Blackallbacteria) CG18_big_fil_WC_8_21_14_2_50_49_26]PIW15866.1 MAG: hypothetical protein COW36_15460 [bacterium (Candidatus Blackallbacteria) CG17_big_fil_post_rev_8_21_14_2_50_48_46]PIW49435.1 MAG: hypothetical protein COW20_05950 [bacterium (Candidatus Blackallbacteria) CG13_big_fil_rev_8_21_14_2_50_49_14]